MQKHQDADIICFEEVNTSREERKIIPIIQEDLPLDLKIPEIILWANFERRTAQSDIILKARFV